MALGDVLDMLVEIHGRKAVRAATLVRVSRRERTSWTAHVVLWGLVEATKQAMRFKSNKAACLAIASWTPKRDRLSGASLLAAYNRAQAHLRHRPEHRRSADQWRGQLLEMWQQSGKQFSDFAVKLIEGWHIAAEARKRRGEPVRRIWPSPIRE
jgi:hypothetical protein